MTFDIVMLINYLQEVPKKMKIKRAVFAQIRLLNRNSLIRGLYILAYNFSARPRSAVGRTPDS